MWYQVRLGCQEFIDSGFVMSVIPSTSSVLVPSRVGSVSDVSRENGDDAKT